jgi:hypothetical protein
MTEDNFSFLTAKDDETKDENESTEETTEESEVEDSGDESDIENEESSTEDQESEEESGDENETKHKRTVEQQLHEERGWRRRLSEELKETKAQLAALASRAELMMSQISTKGQEQESDDEVPDPENDPLGFIAHEMASLRSEIKQLKGEREKETQTQTQREQHAAILNAARESSEAFMKRNPEFSDAMNFLTDARTKELQSIGIKENQIRAALENDILVLTANALQNGVDPATMLFNVAKSRGFRPKKLAAQAPNTLGSVLGAQRTSGKNKDVTQMSDKEFDAFFNKLRQSK